MSLAEQLAKRATMLRPCQTVVTRQDGCSFVETRDGSELDSCGFKVFDRNSYNVQCPGFVIDTQPDLRCSEVLPYLLLGSQDVAADEDLLFTLGVTHVLSLIPPHSLEAAPHWFLTIEGKIVLSCGDEGNKPMDVEAFLKLNREEVSIIAEQGKVNEPNSDVIRRGPVRVYLPALDTPEHQLCHQFSAAHRFIKAIKVGHFKSDKTQAVRTVALGQEGCKVLVHCNAGVSRAPTLVIAYLMKEYRHSLEEATRKVAAVRSFIRPNVGFLDQLKQYESELSM